MGHVDPGQLLRGTLGLGAGFLTAATLAAAAAALLAGCGCGPTKQATDAYPREFGAVSLVLDAEHPMAEQRVSVHFNAEALPATGVNSAQFVVSMRPASHGASASPGAAPLAVPPEVTILSDETGQVLALPEQPTLRYMSPEWVRAAVPLDCPPGKSCDRAYRVRVAVPGLTTGQRVSVDWDVLGTVEYSGAAGECGIPNRAAGSAEATAPALIPAAQAAFAMPTEWQQVPGKLVARHLTVTSRGPAPGAASIGLSTAVQLQDHRLLSWEHFWVRVLADGATSPVVSQLVGKRLYVEGGLDIVARLDIPVLTDCPATGTCSRGYWIVIDDFDSGAEWPSAGLSADPYQVDWTISGTAAYPHGGTTAPVLSVAFNDRANPLIPISTVDAAADPVTLTASSESVAIDATLFVPGHPPATAGLDPLAVAVALVDGSHHSAIGTRIEGGSAGSVAGTLFLDTGRFVEHPFERCPPAGPCTVTLRLIGDLRPRQLGSGPDSATLSWTIQMVGAPLGTTVTFGRPYVLSPSLSLVIDLRIVVGLAAIVLVTIWQVRRRWRRRRAVVLQRHERD